MEHPSPARAFAALSNIVPAGRSAAGAFQKLGLRKIGHIRNRIGGAAARPARSRGGPAPADISPAPTLTMPADVKAGAGNDRIWLANGSDTVDAGDGNDLIWTRGGDDKVLGGAGDDTFKGDEGNDT